MSNPLGRAILLENYHNPVNNSKPEAYTYRHKLDNRSCGDEITVFANVVDGKLKSMNYEIQACALTIASASLLSQELVGKSLVELKNLDQKYIEELLGEKLSTSRVKCGLLPLRALQQALELREKVKIF